MKKLLIIGNSHVGSLKRAWDGMRSTYDMDVELSFAATRGQGLLNAHIKNGVLSIENDPHAERGLVHTYGRKTLDLLKPGFDHILVYGLKLEPNFLITYDSFADRHYSENVRKLRSETRFVKFGALILLDEYSRSWGLMCGCHVPCKP